MLAARNRYAALAVIAAVLMAACVQEGGGTAADAAAEEGPFEAVFEDGVLQPLPDGFPEDNITIINVDEAGSRDGLYARALDQALEDISPVDIVVSDEPRAAGGTVDTLVETRDREGGSEGYSVIVMSILGTATDFHAVPYERDLDVTLEDINFFIATETYPYVLAQRADAEWGDTFDDFVAYGRDNPGELRYISGGVGSGVDVTMEWLLSELDIEVTKIPAADRDAAIAAVGGGEGDFTLTQPEIALSAEQAGRAEVIFVSTEEVPDEWADREGLASAADYQEYDVAEATWGSVQGLMVPNEVPESHVLWLSALFEAAADTEVYQQRGETQAGISLQRYSAEEANELAVTLYEFSEPVIRAVGLHWEDQ